MPHLPGLAGLLLVIGTFASQLSQLHELLAAAHPAGDHAVFELNVRRASSFEQRLGPYSQGFYHPGPAYFYWLLPAYAISGQSTFGLYVAAQILTLVFLLGCCAIVARWSGSLSAVLTLVPLLLIEMAYLGDYPRFDYWPPYVLFFGYALFLLIASALFSGKFWALGPLLVVGSFLVQTHVSYAPAVLVASALSLAHAVFTRPRFLRGPERLNLLLGALLFAVMWALPIHAELLEGPSNFARLYRAFFQEPPAAEAGLGTIADKLALEFTGPWQFVLFGDRFIVPDAPKHYTAARVMASIQLVLLAIAWRKARIRAERFTEALCVVCAASLLAAAGSLTQARGALAPHHTAWISIIGFASWVAIVAGWWVIDVPRWALRATPRWLFLIGAWFTSCLVWPIRIIPAVHANPEIRVLAESVARVIRAAEPGRVRISWEPQGRDGRASQEALTWATAVMLELEKSRLRFFTGPNPDLRWMLGKPRWESAADPAAELVFSSGMPAPPLERIACVEHGDNYFLRYPICIAKKPGRPARAE